MKTLTTMKKSLKNILTGTALGAAAIASPITADAQQNACRVDTPACAQENARIDYVRGPASPVEAFWINGNDTTKAGSVSIPRSGPYANRLDNASVSPAVIQNNGRVVGMPENGKLALALPPNYHVSARQGSGIAINHERSGNTNFAVINLADAYRTLGGNGTAPVMLPFVVENRSGNCNTPCGSYVAWVPVGGKNQIIANGAPATNPHGQSGSSGRTDAPPARGTQPQGGAADSTTGNPSNKWLALGATYGNQKTDFDAEPGQAIGGMTNTNYIGGFIGASIPGANGKRQLYILADIGGVNGDLRGDEVNPRTGVRPDYRLEGTDISATMRFINRINDVIGVGGALGVRHVATDGESRNTSDSWNASQSRSSLELFATAGSRQDYLRLGSRAEFANGSGDAQRQRFGGLVGYTHDGLSNGGNVLLDVNGAVIVTEEGAKSSLEGRALLRIPKTNWGAYVTGTLEGENTGQYQNRGVVRAGFTRVF